MAEQIQVEVVTPERLVVNDKAEYIEIPASTGYIGVFPGHAPLITELAVGEITYKSGAETKRLAVAWGFAEVLPQKVTILAETAERAEEIDVARAQAAKQRAEEALRAAGIDGSSEAHAALQRANARLEVAGKR
ncbi:MAG TPA: F0F1 ATP synthase subunit epsilon [Candidatus Acidoferrales bacterium]|jgi:F-type H+-transporting ATPase subunit epsilon|nr:F0F1 ATP synthase subunit epsilon [Candidatus Acidoferrales bacterium]